MNVLLAMLYFILILDSDNYGYVRTHITGAVILMAHVMRIVRDKDNAPEGNIEKYSHT